MRRFPRGILAALLFVGGAARAQPASNSEQVAQGHDLALALCSVCHVAAPDQTEPPMQSNAGPPFRDIANNPQITPAALRTFMEITHSTTTPPFTMPNPRLSEQQVDAVIAYMMSLRGQK
jgi:mono/diheme cytochrome c family protein